jgi:hypothetical protein
MNISQLRKLAFLCLMLTMVLSAKGMGDKRVNLRGTWKFILGDNMKYASPTASDKDWEEIYVPASWNSEGFSNYRGYAWYRRNFEIEFKPNEPLYLELGRIDDADEVYINGKLIGTTGGMPPNYFTAYNINRIYLIPTEYLNEGRTNVISVRVFDEGGEGGIIGKNVGIYSYADHYSVGFQLMGNWKFRLSDNMEWAATAYDDKEWDNIVVPASWESQGFREYDGFAWYRKTFQLPAGFTTQDMVILVGRIDDMDQVFVNGKLVGETGNIERKWARDDEHQRPRTYFLPDGLLKPGASNTIAVRVYDQTGQGGIYEGPVTLIPRSKYKEFWKDYRDEQYPNEGWWGVLKYWGWD